MPRPTLHVVGFPHTETTREFATCAYTQKIVKFGGMMRQLGWRVVVYSGEENEADCDEHVALVTRAERERWFGPHDQGGLWGNVEFNAALEPWATMNDRAVAAIRLRAEKRDLVLLLGGLAQAPVAAGVLPITACEWGIGYDGVFSRFCAFESAAWRHYVYGRWNLAAGTAGHSTPDGRWYDAVIPNFFDPADFPDLPGPGADPYLLFVGRVILRKGPHVAAEVAKRAGMRLVVAGPGGQQPRQGRHRGKIFGDGVELDGDVEYVGPVGVEERAKLMAGATALLAPTLYIEPFGGVAVEAMLSGTPAVTSDWGAFSETVEEGVTGYRFCRIAEGARAVEYAAKIPRQVVRARALERYSLAAVGPLYDRWFTRLDGVWGDNDFFGSDAPPPLAKPARAPRRRAGGLRPEAPAAA